MGHRVSVSLVKISLQTQVSFRTNIVLIIHGLVPGTGINFLVLALSHDQSPFFFSTVNCFKQSLDTIEIIFLQENMYRYERNCFLHRRKYLKETLSFEVFYLFTSNPLVVTQMFLILSKEILKYSLFLCCGIFRIFVTRCVHHLCSRNISRLTCNISNAKINLEYSIVFFLFKFLKISVSTIPFFQKWQKWNSKI
jgi:hypothetical protein